MSASRFWCFESLIREAVASFSFHTFWKQNSLVSSSGLRNIRAPLRSTETILVCVYCVESSRCASQKMLSFSKLWALENADPEGLVNGGRLSISNAFSTFPFFT